MNHLERMIADLRRRNVPVPTPPKLPTETEISAIEKQTEVDFHADFRRLLLTAGDIVFSTIDIVSVIDPDSHSYFPRVLKSARFWGVPDDLIPICEDSDGDYFCMKFDGGLRYWSHDGETDETWPDLATWIEDVWIGEALDDEDEAEELGELIKVNEELANEEDFPKDDTVGSHRQRTVHKGLGITQPAKYCSFKLHDVELFAELDDNELAIRIVHKRGDGTRQPASFALASWQTVMPQGPLFLLALEAVGNNEGTEPIEINKEAFDQEWRLAIEMLERDLIALKTTS